MFMIPAANPHGKWTELKMPVLYFTASENLPFVFETVWIVYRHCVLPILPLHIKQVAVLFLFWKVHTLHRAAQQVLLFMLQACPPLIVSNAVSAFFQ